MKQKQVAIIHFNTPELTERIATMWKKYTAVSEPTPMILENMRQEAKKLTDDVKAYLESLNE